MYLTIKLTQCEYELLSIFRYSDDEGRGKILGAAYIVEELAKLKPGVIEKARQAVTSDE